ncbi:MAG: hypothetical protein HQL29_03345 [Candidatus Omnitrophica bacterium]|nr:hypothetical protein [Candidatus Omnitrophota bacterium]
MGVGIKKILFQISVVVIFFSAAIVGNCQQTDENKLTLSIFHSPGCSSCIKVEREIVPKIEEKYADKIILEYRDIDIIENYTLLLGLQEKHGIVLKGSLPVFYMCGHFINGYDNIKNGWESFIENAMKLSCEKDPGVLPEVDLILRFKRFTPAIIIGVGFIDGLNPCAFTVIIFFMSFMALQGYKKKELVGIGISFIFAVFITYLLIGLGAFGFLYRLNRFWLLVKIINYSIGVFSIIFGILAAYDFFKFLSTGKTEGMLLQLPKGIKNQIHKVIRLFGRVTNRTTGIRAERKSSIKVIVSALLTGFLVSLLEAVCTGQAYLPTISFILKTSPLKLKAAGYLLLYNFMFVVPLLIIFVFAVLGVTTERFSGFFKKYLLPIKFIMAILFFGFGVFLIWRA